jgi:hypothetical protein
MSAVVASAAVLSALRRVSERIEIPPFRMLDMVVAFFVLFDDVEILHQPTQAA